MVLPLLEPAGVARRALRGVLAAAEGDVTEQAEQEAYEDAVRAAWRQLRRAVLCGLGRHVWAGHSNHMHYLADGVPVSVVSTPCIHCPKRKRKIDVGIRANPKWRENG